MQSSSKYFTSSQSLVSTDQSTSSTESDESLAVSTGKTINDYRTMDPNKYIFIFVKNSPNNNAKNSSGIGYIVDVDYLMDEAFSSIDNLAPYLRNGDYNIDIVKKWVSPANLDKFLLEINNANQEDESTFDDRNPNLDIYLSGSRSPEIISSRVEPYNIFVIGSFTEQMVDFLAPKPGITISPLTIAYWRQYGENLVSHLKTLSDSQPLCGECLKNTLVYFSDIIPPDGRYLLYKLLKFMGGFVADKLDLEVTHAVSETDSGSASSSQDKRIIAAYFLEIPIVNTNWIHTAWLQLQLQCKFASNHNFVRTYLCGQPSVDAKPILKSFTIGVLASVYSDEEKAKYFQNVSSINNVVVRFGGRFVVKPNCLEFQNINLILHLYNNSSKQKRKNLTQTNDGDCHILDSYKNDADYRRLIERQCDETLPIVTIDWLVDTIIEFKVQSFEKYLIKEPDSMASHRSPEEILQEIQKDFDENVDDAFATSWIESSSQLERIQKRKK